MKENTALRKRILAALFLAIGLILPFITMQIPAVGKMLCPMHIPVLLCGYICGGPYGLLIGIITPLLRGVLFGMPAIFPNAFCMAFELATYGLVAGILSEKMTKMKNGEFDRSKENGCTDKCNKHRTEDPDR